MAASKSKHVPEDAMQMTNAELGCENPDTTDLDPESGTVSPAHCGIGMCTPAMLNGCATMPVFTAFYSVNALMTATLTFYVSSQVTTLERQFGFSSSETGFIMAANDIGFLALILFISFIATKVHIPRALGVFTLLFGFSGIVCALPQFLYGAPSPTSLGGADVSNVSAVTSGGLSGRFRGQLCDGVSQTRLNWSGVVEDSTLTTSQDPDPDPDPDPGSTARAHSVAALWLIVAGMVLQGVAKCPRSSFCLFFVDSNVDRVDTGFYMGIITAVGMMGPGLAFALGGVFSSVYVTLEDTDLDYRHPRWIGAWWLGFLTFGCAASVCALPLFCFPRRLTGREDEVKVKDKVKVMDGVKVKDKVKDEGKDEGVDLDKGKDENMDEVKDKGKDEGKVKDKGTDGGKVKDKDKGKVKDKDKDMVEDKDVRAPAGHPVTVLSRYTQHVKDFLAVMKRLLTNPVYMCLVLSTCSLLFEGAGIQTFNAKYLENQFDLPAWKANMTIAGVLLGTGCAGTFAGGYLTKRLKMGPLVSLKVIAAIVAGGVILVMLHFLFRCEQPYLYNSPGPRAAAAVGEGKEGCMDGCVCEEGEFFPVCGQDGRTFFSPCHAGCSHTVQGNYVNCTCIEGGRAVAGLCQYSCAMLYPFVLNNCLDVLLTTVSIIPKLLVYARCVEDRDKAFAVGFSSFMTSILGWLLGPIYFGKLIDGICIHWEGSSGRGACRLYDNDVFRLKLIGYRAVFRVLALVLAILAYLSARVTRKFEVRDQGRGQGAAKMAAKMEDREDNDVSAVRQGLVTF